MKQILLLISITATATLPSCSATHGLNGRIVTDHGELSVQPNGGIDITLNPTK